MTLMERRMALMGQQNGRNIIFEWDYTEGLSKIKSVASIAPVLESDGVLLQSGNTNYSACAVAPDIPPLVDSYIAEITYKNAVPGGQNGLVGFWHYNEERKRVAIMRYSFNDNVVGRISRPNSMHDASFVPAASGTMVIRYNAEADKITFSQGDNTQTLKLNGVTAWAQQARIVSAHRGESAGTSSVKLIHIKIERV